MKRYVLFFLAWASTLSLFAEDPRYFRELYDENAPLEQRYNYLLGKRISVEKKIAFFYTDTVVVYFIIVFNAQKSYSSCGIFL